MQSILLGSSCWKLELIKTSLRGLTNSAHDTGVISEFIKGNCTKELEVQFSLSNSSDETER